MCYTVAYLTKRKIKYARRAGADEAEVRELELQLEELTGSRPAMYHVSGFVHPQLLCFGREDGPRFELLRWGLIPHWVKDHAQAAKLGRQTLNARAETLFEKPAFRKAAHHRCLVLVDGFFEYHHLAGRSYPYHIRARNGEVLALGGIRSLWHDPQDGSPIHTVSIVTTVANPLLERIHNNPKAEGPRMPFIVPPEKDAEWLAQATEPAVVQALVQPYAEEALEAYPVGPLLGKEAMPNAPQALEQHHYPVIGLP
jgi:putative SOS response-associated peptidase YedK